MIKLSAPVIIASLATLLFIIAMLKQFRILYMSEQQDPLLKSKMLFFMFNLFNVLTTAIAMCAYYYKDERLLVPSSIFYFIASCIAVWTYYANHNTKPL